MPIFRRDPPPLTGASNAGEVGRSRDLEPISGFTEGQVLSTRPAVDHGHRPASCDIFMAGRILRVFDHYSHRRRVSTA